MNKKNYIKTVLTQIAVVVCLSMMTQTALANAKTNPLRGGAQSPAAATSKAEGGDSLSRGHRLVVRTNLLYGAALTPNLGFDYALSRHWSLGANVGFNPFEFDTKKNKKWKHLLIAPELRYWNDSVFKAKSSYWGVNAIYSHYNVGNVEFPFGMYKDARDYRMQGDLAAIGLFYGYTWRMGRLFRMEAEIGVGAGYSWSKKYDCGDCGEYLGRSNKPFLVPKLALNLVLDPKRREVKQQAPVQVLPPVVEEEKEPATEIVELLVRPFDVMTLADTLAFTHPILERYENYRPYDKTRVLRKEPGMLYVHFPLDKTILRRDFRDNAQVLDVIVSLTKQILQNQYCDVRLIQLIGLASVEGPVKHNQDLSDGRALALRDYVISNVPGVTADRFEVIGGGEAWAEFRDQVNDLLKAVDTDRSTYSGNRNYKADLQAVLDIIDTEPNLDKREQKLRRLGGGRVYRMFQRELQVLADQRNSGYIRIYFERLPDQRAVAINKASELLQQKRYDEALSLLEGVKDDPRSWNAYGVAVFMTGRQEEGLNYIRMAAAQGNPEAIENIKRINE